MGESLRDFGVEVMKKSKLKKIEKQKKRKLLNTMVSNFLYSNSYHSFKDEF